LGTQVGARRGESARRSSTFAPEVSSDVPFAAAQPARRLSERSATPATVEARPHREPGPGFDPEVGSGARAGSNLSVFSVPPI
jgi:hypothetical protein